MVFDIVVGAHYFIWYDGTNRIPDGEYGIANVETLRITVEHFYTGFHGLSSFVFAKSPDTLVDHEVRSFEGMHICMCL